MPTTPRYADAARRPESEGIVRYIWVLRERWWLVVACVVLALGGAAAYAEIAPKSYQAQAVLEVQPSNSNDAVLSALPVLHQSGDPTQDILTAASLVTTSRVASAVVAAEHLHMSANDALAHISATPVGQTGLVAIQGTASSPRVAQQLANGFMAQTIALSTARMHAAINTEMPGLNAQVAAIPPGQRYGPGSLGAEVDELQQLLRQNDPTLSEASTATLPQGPSSPNKKLALIAGLIAGLLLGVGGAFGLNAVDPKLRREEQLRELLAIPILARIARERRYRPSPLLPRELSIASQEGYRTLRTSLAARAASMPSLAILITGSGTSEGKSTTAISLAIAFAQTHARVILIEADLRRPTFAGVFGLGRYHGIHDVLEGRIDLASAVTNVKAEGATLGVVAAEASSSESVNRLSYEQVRDLVSEAQLLADYVIIDSPPLTAVIDPLPFAQVADEVVLVARLDRSKLKDLVELDDLLRRHGVVASGVVVIGETGRLYHRYGEYMLPTSDRGIPLSDPRERGRSGRSEPMGPPRAGRARAERPAREAPRP